MENMRTKLGAVALATSMVLGAGIAAAATADAQDSSETQSERIEQRDQRLQTKVDEGVITQERADEIRARMAARAAQRDARQANRAELTDELAITLGTTADDLIAELRSGTSLADIAEAAGVNVDTIIDQIESQRVDRLNQAVAEGRLDQARADAKLETLRDDITARVNGERPEGRQGPRGPRTRGHRGLGTHGQAGDN